MAKLDSNMNPLSKSRGLRRRTGGIADWASASSEKVMQAIELAARTGGAIRFGYSRDGGAYALGIYGDGKPYTVFVTPAEDIDATLDDVIELFETISDDVKIGSNGHVAA